MLQLELRRAFARGANLWSWRSARRRQSSPRGLELLLQSQNLGLIRPPQLGAERHGCGEHGLSFLGLAADQQELAQIAQQIEFERHRRLVLQDGERLPQPVFGRFEVFQVAQGPAFAARQK
jgi:hypothetical protein